MSDVEFFKQSPAFVLVDTRIVANSPERYLVAGMGDALATWYEAHACSTNLRGKSCVGARPTLAAGAIAEVCAATLFADGAGLRFS
jgi:glycerol dehydrogenase